MKKQTKGRFEAPHLRRPAAKVLIWALLLLSLMRIGAEGCRLFIYADVFVGGKKMLVYSEIRSVEMPDLVSADSTPITKLNDGTTIIYQDHTYELNRDLATILVLGIDHSIQNEKVSGNGGQSDVILLVAMDTQTGETKILNISREANAEVDVYSADNAWIGTRFEQITLAYAYGNGRETSCENTVRSVSRLLYGLPIASYLALDMDSIKEANEAVGGVTLQSLIDIKMPDGTQVKQGDTIELHGKNLERYIRVRGSDLQANAKRMERQKQYITEFSKLVEQKSRETMSFPAQLFSTLSPYIVTNMEISDITFLSTSYLQQGAKFQLLTLDGSFSKYNGSTIFEVDETSLFETTLQIFYRQVD